MQNKKPTNQQKQFLCEGLSEMLNPNDALYQLSYAINWDTLEQEFSHYYIDFGRPAKPTRLMITLILLKQIYNKGDETVVEEWIRNPYWQYLSGFETFQWKVPCDPSDLVHFRNRIGAEGIKRIFQISVELHGESVVSEDEVVIDTTVQEKNIAFPTDTNLYRKIAEACLKIAKREELTLRRTYSVLFRNLFLPNVDAAVPRLTRKRSRQLRSCRR